MVCAISAPGLLAIAIGRLPLSTNARPEDTRVVRMLTQHRAQLLGPTVTVAVLAAVSRAMYEMFDE